MANNQGIIHISHAPGKRPICGRRNAHQSTTVDRAASWGRVCVKCMGRLSDASRAKLESEIAAHQRPALAKIGDQRWRADHVSYKAWCELARKRGWNGEDGLRAHAEPDEAATITFHASLDAAVVWAKATFAAAPDDSAFSAILIEHQELQGAHDDRGNPVRRCPPTWENLTTYEVTSDGDVSECGGWT